MARIEIRGIIVGADYDDGWFQGAIDKGIITPESCVRKACAAITAGEDVQVYINSRGGSVFAAAEMENMIRDAVAISGKKLTVSIGALAASAAAVLALRLRDIADISAAPNAKLMFHGASSYTEGGKGAHEDTAGLLAKITGEFSDKLKALGVPSATVDEWMSEGRAGWLTASEAKGYGIIDSIIGEEDKEPDLVALDIAACLENSGVAIPENAKEIPVVQPVNSQLEIVAKLTADHAVAIGEIVAKHNEEIGKRDALVSKLQSEKDKAVAQVDRLEKLLNDSTAKLEKLTAGALGFVPVAEVTTWADAIKAAGGDYVTARRMFPDVFQKTLKKL